MNRIWTIMKKELLHIWRDPRTMVLIVGLPAILLLLLGYGISGDSLNISMGVVDMSKSDASRAFVQRFTASQDFNLRYEALSEAELQPLIEIDEVDVGILIPESFSRDLLAGNQVRVQILVDGSANPTDSMTIQLKLASIASMASQDILLEQYKLAALGQKLAMPIDANVRTLYNPSSSSTLYMIPGLIPIILQVQTLLLASLAIVREREQGTMEQLIVTPIKTWELMLGKIIPYLFICIIDLLMMLALGEWLFNVSVRGNFGQLMGLSVIFILGSLGMGVLISNISQSQMQAVYISVFVVIIPAIILSGLMFSRESMPSVTYWYSELLPVTQYLEITRGIIVRGTNADTLLYTSTIPMVAMSIFYFVASIFAFRKHI